LGRPIASHDKDVTRIGPWQIRGDLQARIFARRDVFRAMDDNVHLASEEGSLDIRDECPFTPGHVRCASVALRLDDDQAAPSPIKRERLGNQPGLGEGERAAPRADPDRCSAHSPNSSRMARS